MENKLLMAGSVPTTTSHKPLRGQGEPSTLACWAALRPLLSSRGPITRQGGSEPRFPVQGPLCTVSCPPAFPFLPGVQASPLANRPGFEVPAQETVSSPAGCLGSASAPRGQESQRTRWVSIGPQMRQPLTYLPGPPVVSATRN